MSEGVVLQGRVAFRNRLRSEATIWLGGALGSSLLLLGAVTSRDRQTVAICCYLAAAVPLFLFLRETMRVSSVRLLSSPSSESRPGQLRIAGDSLSVDAPSFSHTAKRADIADVCIEPLGEGRRALVVRMRDRSVWSVRELSPDACNAALDALGIPPSARMTRAYLAAASEMSVAAERLGFLGLVGGAIFSFIAVVAGTAPILTGHTVSLAFVPLITGGITLLASALWARRHPLLELCNDTLRIRWLLRRLEFPIASLRRVDATETQLSLVDAAGRTWKLDVVPRAIAVEDGGTTDVDDARDKLIALARLLARPATDAANDA